MKRVTIADVAKRAGVSKSTASQFLNKRYEYMSEDTRKRIMKAIKDLNYQPNAVARSLKVKRTNTIGFIVSNILHSTYTAILRGVEDFCNNRNYNVILCNSDDNPKKELEYIRMLQSKQVDGIIIISTGKNNDTLRDLIENDYPVVLLDRNFEELKTDTITVNNYQGASRAIEHLVQLGHHNIGVISPFHEGFSPRLDRIKGVYDTAETYGCADQLMVRQVKDIGRTEQVLDQFFQSQNRPTAIFTINDRMTTEVLKYIKKKKMLIPDELALVTFDDLNWFELMTPALTTIKQPTYELGVMAAQLMLDRLEQGDKLDYRQIVKDCQLVIRESCGFRKTF